MPITLVKISLDEDVPEYMNGIFRIGSVISEDEKGNESHHEDLVDNLEFRSIDALKQHVANSLNVDGTIVEIEQ
ncbi:hypothetical protein [Acinetobacter junii]|uniref:hypothetical protein n=1 Tax=Acinetobacter junii TaxID=40215 RepID=UPI0012502F7F|nr:hypothetical protein [Acinetobacter junii]